ncbi:MAG: hypothetical protein LBG09_01000 [Puniceicoccales bacterium]|jgi:hypothetical protein|nr:hypothetical protein [Puniceicoccales bacterium]
MGGVAFGKRISKWDILERGVLYGMLWGAAGINDLGSRAWATATAASEPEENFTALSPSAVAAMIGDNMHTANGTIIRHATALKELSVPKEACFLNVWGALNFSHQSAALYDSNGGNGLIGLDFAYDHFILKRTCYMGFFSGFTGNHCDLVYGKIQGDGSNGKKSASTGDLRTWYGGYYGNYNIWGFDISTISSIGISKPKDREYFSLRSTNIAGPTSGSTAGGSREYRFLRNVLAFHSKIDIYRSFFEGNDWKIGPNIALNTGNFRQKIDNKKYETDSSGGIRAIPGGEERLHLKLDSVEGSIGLKCEKNNEQFRAHLFLGVERSFCKHWSTSHTDRSPEDILESQRETQVSFDKTKCLITMGFRFNYSQSCFVDFNFLGRYGRNYKNSAIGLAFNKVF